MSRRGMSRGAQRMLDNVNMDIINLQARNPDAYKALSGTQLKLEVGQSSTVNPPKGNPSRQAAYDMYAEVEGKPSVKLSDTSSGPYPTKTEREKGQSRLAIVIILILILFGLCAIGLGSDMVACLLQHGAFFCSGY